MLALAVSFVVVAGLTAAVYFGNVRRLQPPAEASELFGIEVPAVSVLIPARNEEGSIAAAVDSVLGQTDAAVQPLAFEVIVLDDASDDATAAIVRNLAADDDRVRLESSRPLPAGWCGKQSACWQLAAHARFDRLLFLDADVRLEPHALLRTLAHFEAIRHTAREARRTPPGLLSGVPRQLVGSLRERLLVPLIHFVLLGYLPIGRMRRSDSPAYAAGCGQYLLVDRTAYDAAGGHAGIRESMHDGLRLPKLFREHGQPTDLLDATSLARCRMYDNPAEVWPGFAKNAVEGLAHPARIGPFAVLFLLGHILPGLLLPALLIAAAMGMAISPLVLGLTAAAVAMGMLVRADMVGRFGHPWSAVLLHPLSIATLLALQVTALVQHLCGRRPRWKGRGVAEPAAASDGRTAEATEAETLSRPPDVPVVEADAVNAAPYEAVSS